MPRKLPPKEQDQDTDGRMKIDICGWRNYREQEWFKFFEAQPKEKACVEESNAGESSTPLSNEPARNFRQPPLVTESHPRKRRTAVPLDSEYADTSNEPLEAPNEAQKPPELPPNGKAGLDNSVPLDIHHVSDFPEVRNAVNVIYAEFKASGVPGHEKITKEHIKLVILNLYVCWLSDPTRYVAYHRGSGAYLNVNCRYNKLHISRRTVAVADALIQLGYAEGEKGFFDRRPGGKSRVARMRATDKLIGLIRERHIERYMIESAPNRECIILRNYDEKSKRKFDADYQDTPDTRRMRQELYAYNNLLRRTHIDLQEGPGIVIPDFDREQKFVRRIFNDNRWDHGGRFYGGWWQNIPSELRGRIRMDGQITVERDYSGIHIMLLYIKEGIEYRIDDRGDPYVLKGYEQHDHARLRSFLKMALLVIINAKSRPSALKAIHSEIQKNFDDFGWIKHSGINVSALIEAFQERHAPIRKYFFSGMGVKLQHIDSQIAEKVINTFTTRNHIVLCIHDSFVVMVIHWKLLRRVMDRAFIQIADDVFRLKISAPRMKQIGRIIFPYEPDEYGDFVLAEEFFESHPEELDERGLADDRSALANRLKEFRARSIGPDYFGVQ